LPYIVIVEKKPLYTIGHGSREADNFLTLLQTYGIEYLIDVRSQPFSRFHPQFSQRTLKLFLEDNGIRYVFMGDELGGRPKDASCYDSEGRIDYEMVKTKEYFKKGIDRLKTAYEKDLNVTIMCSERNPAHCHRTKLIAEVLVADNITVKHIDETGKIKEHAAVIKEIKKGPATGDLFGGNE
jgi:uncharacterized protein (DUF488 family)